jgi:hypothetical protein
MQAVEVRAPILSNVVQVLQANPIQQRMAQLDAAGNPPASVHKLTPTPSPDIVTGIQARVKAWVEEFIAEAQRGNT